MSHPKSCKYWLKDIRGCLTHDLCKFLHKNNEKGIGIKGLEEKVENILVTTRQMIYLIWRCQLQLKKLTNMRKVMI